jgi:hypothetical protein
MVMGYGQVQDVALRCRFKFRQALSSSPYDLAPVQEPPRSLFTRTSSYTLSLGVCWALLHAKDRYQESPTSTAICAPSRSETRTRLFSAASVGPI